MGTFTTTKTMTSSSPSPSPLTTPSPSPLTTPYNITIEEPQRVQSVQNAQSAQPLSSRKTLSRQQSMSESQRELAWEKKRHQMRMQERKRDLLTIENPNELSDEDLNELKGCIELGFVFNEEKGGQSLTNTFPALDLYFAVNRLSSPTGSPRSTGSSRSNLAGFGSSSSKSLDEGSLAQAGGEDPWKICSPGENPQQVKTKLRHWAQLVACSVRQSS